MVNLIMNSKKEKNKTYEMKTNDQPTIVSISGGIFIVQKNMPKI